MGKSADAARSKGLEGECAKEKRRPEKAGRRRDGTHEMRSGRWGQATNPRRAAATAAVWPGMVLARRWRSSAVVRFISRRGKRRPKNFIAISIGLLQTARLRALEWGRSFTRLHIGLRKGKLNRKSEPLGMKSDMVAEENGRAAIRPPSRAVICDPCRFPPMFRRRGVGCFQTVRATRCPFAVQAATSGSHARYGSANVQRCIARQGDQGTKGLTFHSPFRLAGKSRLRRLPSRSSAGGWQLPCLRWIDYRPGLMFNQTK